MEGERMCDQCADTPSPSPKWRREAVVRLFRGLVIGDKDSGAHSYRDCWVRQEAVESETGEIKEANNDYESVQIDSVSYSAHVAMLILVENRFPRRVGNVETDEQGMHLCNNPACRNPLHLKFGSHRENCDYIKLCGRTTVGIKNGHSTKPERTLLGENCHQTQLKGEERKLAIRLLKKYDGRGAPHAIADYFNVSVFAIYNLRKQKMHLRPDVEYTDVELKIVPRRKRDERGDHFIRRQKMVASIRQRFHDAPVAERTGLLLQFEHETGLTHASLMNILLRKTYSAVSPEIPIPTEFGSGSRKGRRHPDWRGKQH